MSQTPPPDEGKDIKPKLNLTISYDGTPVTVKVKANMKFEKIFHVVEQKFNKQAGTFKFTYDGTRVAKEDTPAGLGMEDGDQIDAHLEQLGGGSSR
ncbi:ubiquitin-related domain-containing protein [Schizophyllum amplum]|uniref:Ubiquitin-related domain-containing protein n=1 Tax=Schizophyllum amplum TaxID=97359 RepID=A0A550CFX4_9AGAR|nr:ubiquitin-related domain-containing protein [Auriculariopsis ampla]